MGKGEWDSRSQKVGVLLARHLAGKVLRGEMVLVPLGRARGQAVGALLEELERVGLVYLVALGRGDAVLNPLPELAPGHLGGGGILPARRGSAKGVGVEGGEEGEELGLT